MELNTDAVFFITVFTEIKKNPDEKEAKISPFVIDYSQTVGVFPTLERCEGILARNTYDIHDNAGYEYAVVEAYEFNAIYPEKIQTLVYKARHYEAPIPVMGDDGTVEMYKDSRCVTYERVELDKDVMAFLEENRFAL